MPFPPPMSPPPMSPPPMSPPPMSHPPMPHPPMSFAPSSHARTLLQLTYETDRALREGRLGAEEWFAFVSALEALARKIEHRAPPARFANDEAKKEVRVLSFPSSASASSASAAYASPSATRAKEER